MTNGPSRGLPPRIYLPITGVFALILVTAIVLLVRQSLSTGGSVFGAGTGAGAPHAQGVQAPQGPPAVSVEGGGPPPAVRQQLQELRTRIERNPKDDVALTQLADMYLAAGKYEQAIPFYRRALTANKSNVAAQEGLQQAQSALAK